MKTKRETRKAVVRTLRSVGRDGAWSSGNELAVYWESFRFGSICNVCGRLRKGMLLVSVVDSTLGICLDCIVEERIGGRR
jgi:hypothetical protein